MEIKIIFNQNSDCLNKHIMFEMFSELCGHKFLDFNKVNVTGNIVKATFDNDPSLAHELDEIAHLCWYVDDVEKITTIAGGQTKIIPHP